MKKNMKKPNCKTDVWVHASSVWYSINWKVLMELEAALKAEGGPMQY